MAVSSLFVVTSLTQAAEFRDCNPASGLVGFAIPRRRASIAARPAGCIRPKSVRARTRPTFTLLQALPDYRRVMRTMYLSASRPLRTPSIQP